MDDQIIGRIAVLEYVLAQALVLLVNRSQDPQWSLLDLQDSFVKSFERSSLSAEQRRFAHDAAERLFSTVRDHLIISGDNTH